MSDQDTSVVTFADLVGEDKRYDSPDALAKAKAHADAHIKKLEAELAELRNKEEFQQKVKAEPDQTPDQTAPASKDTASPDIRSEMQEMLKQHERKLEFRQFLSSQYGDKSLEAVTELATEVGKTPEQIEQLFVQDPSLARALFAKKQAVTFKSSIPSSNVNPTQTTSDVDDSKKWLEEYNAALRKRDRRKTKAMDPDGSLYIQHYQRTRQA